MTDTAIKPPEDTTPQTGVGNGSGNGCAVRPLVQRRQW